MWIWLTRRGELKVKLACRSPSGQCIDVRAIVDLMFSGITGVISVLEGRVFTLSLCVPMSNLWSRVLEQRRPNPRVLWGTTPWRLLLAFPPSPLRILHLFLSFFISRSRSLPLSSHSLFLSIFVYISLALSLPLSFLSLLLSLYFLCISLYFSLFIFFLSFSLSHYLYYLLRHDFF